MLSIFASRMATRLHTVCPDRASRWRWQEHIASKYQNVRSDAEERDDLSQEKSRLCRVDGG